MTTIFVGVDVGGTKTSAAVGSATEVLSRASGTGAAVRPGRALASAQTIAEVARKALAASGALTARAMVVGAAGAGRAAEREELQRALAAEKIADLVQVTTDIELALVAAFGTDPGIVLSAGTGSIALGRDATGATHRAGGYGWQMGDEGSGYGIGRAALGAVSRAHDRRGPATKLTLRVMAAAKARSFDDLINWATLATPADVASLAPGVMEMSAHGDAVAQGIVDYAVRELVLLATALAPLISKNAVPVALSGGILGEEGLLRAAVTAKLREAPALSVREAPVEGALGALTMARMLAEK
ncbi:MAG TPA: BadF/BadG/BcrA/BcrD ATPase family protein [Gemmatimonadales bacterium]|nr:BadF/BadG/BcrA/BcrD ATPase family protein [Gemmatimonadales bacterium]